MHGLTIGLPVINHVTIQVVRKSAYQVLLRLLSKIPGNVAETFCYASLGAVFVGWQVCALVVAKSSGSAVEISLIAVQVLIVGLLFTKLVIWFRMQSK